MVFTLVVTIIELCKLRKPERVADIIDSLIVIVDTWFLLLLDCLLYQAALWEVWHSFLFSFTIFC